MERCLYAATACVLVSGLFLPPPVPQLDLPRLPSVPSVPGLPTLPGLPAARPTRPYVPSLFQIILHKLGLLEPLRRKHKSLNRMKEMYLYGPENAFRPSNRPRRPPVRPVTLAPPTMPTGLLPPEVATPPPVFATPQAPEVPDDVMNFDDDVDYFNFQAGTNSPAYDYAQAPEPSGPDDNVQVPLAVHYGVEPNSDYSVTTSLPEYDPFNGTLFNEHLPTRPTTTEATPIPEDVEVFGREQEQLRFHPAFRPVQELIQPLFKFGNEGGTIYRKVEVPLSKTEMMVIIDKVPVKQANLLIRNSHQNRGFDFDRLVKNTTPASTTTEDPPVTPPSNVASGKWVTVEEGHHSEVLDAPTLNETDLEMLSDYYEDLVKADLVQDYSYTEYNDDDNEAVTGGRWITVDASADDEDAKPLLLLNRLA